MSLIVLIVNEIKKRENAECELPIALSVDMKVICAKSQKATTFRDLMIGEIGRRGSPKQRANKISDFEKQIKKRYLISKAQYQYEYHMTLKSM